MKILFLLPDFPYPASTGGRLKVLNILKQLSKNNQCEILCFGKLNESNQRGFAKLLPNVHVLGCVTPISGLSKLLSMLWNLARGVPPSFASYSSRKFVSALKTCLAQCQYDVVHYDIVNMAQYWHYASDIPSVHSSNDATSLIYSRMAASIPWSLDKIRWLISEVLLRRFEKATYHFFNKIHVVSQEDAAYLTGLVTNIDVVTIPIAIDDAYLHKIANKHNMTGVPKIVCTGNLGNPAIAKGVLDFVEEALPRILLNVPNARFVVLGQNASKILQEHFSVNSNIEFVSWVEDYRVFLSDADVVLVPDYVGPPGAKTRALQAMGLGLPVVGTDAAFAGIPFINHEHGLLYKTMPECAELILALLSNFNLCEILGENAHHLVVKNFSLTVVGPMYENLYQEAIAKFNLHGNVCRN